MIKEGFKLLLMGSLLLGANAQAQKILKNEGIKINYLDQFDEEQSSVIKRIHDPICKDKSKINGMIPDHIWGDGNYAKSSVPDACKKTFVTTVGIIAPIKIEGVETYGELEVIDYLQSAGEDELLIDARMSAWYKKGTIPGARNLSFKIFDPKHPEFETVMDMANITEEDGKYDFSKAKTMILFCNGTWCPQSTWAIENLIKIGYPKDKLKWYRGGMYGWKVLNLTTIVPKEE